MKLFDTLTKKKLQFTPLKKNKVSIYVCGITPYDTTHLGHAFTYIFFDTLIRYLKWQGFKISYTQNITDINDRDKDILQRAKEQDTSWIKLSNFWTKKFLKDMEKLNWLFPTNYLKASENLDFIFDLIQRLLDKGLAYNVYSGVYLDISKFPQYGRLSRLKESEMVKLAGEFEEDLDNKDKNNPLDQTLWRKTVYNQEPHIPSFNSPFGKGRPGWHIECSAMSVHTLGEQIDIHGGGKDLIYPHHEAEIVQSEGATGKIPFVKYWLHTATVNYKGQKMSKSKGNLVMVSDLFKKYSASAVRWLLLSNRWSKDWEYREKDLKKAEENVLLVERKVKNVKAAVKIPTKFSQIMDDNLNTPLALKFLLELINEGNARDAKSIYQILGFKI